MVKRSSSIQRYPREDDSDFLDTTKLKPHEGKIPQEKLQEIILRAIETAQNKAHREIVNLPEDAHEELVASTYRKGGQDLFNYFRSYFVDPASSAYQYQDRHYSDVAKEQFRNRILQKERMNSAWRYQYIAVNVASQSRRFETVADLALSEADFCAVIRYKETHEGPNSELAIFASVKNRMNTLPGTQWPRAISALEDVAKSDKNKTGDYICVFGISIERGERKIKTLKNTGIPHSSNTEIWLADFFWQFFSNYSYEEIMKNVLEILITTQKPKEQEDVPSELIDSFGDCCREHELIDEEGYFNDPFKLVELFCRDVKPKRG